VVERNNCNNCNFFQIANSWINTPFKLRDRVKNRGADCVSAPLKVWEEFSLISSQQFDEIYSVSMFKLFRRNEKKFLEELRRILGPDFEIFSKTTLKCGDVLFKVVGRNREMFGTVYVNKRFLVARPQLNVCWIDSFEYNYVIRSKHFECLNEM